MSPGYDTVATFTDLIYDPQYIPELRKSFPDLKVEDASDDIHEGRVEVTVTTSRREWFRAVLKAGAAGTSFGFQLGVRTPEYSDLFADLLKELKNE